MIDGTCYKETPPVCSDSKNIKTPCIYNFDQICSQGKSFAAGVCVESKLTGGAVAGIVVAIVVIVAVAVGVTCYFLVSKKKASAKAQNSDDIETMGSKVVEVAEVSENVPEAAQETCNNDGEVLQQSNVVEVPEVQQTDLEVAQAPEGI